MKKFYSILVAALVTVSFGTYAQNWSWTQQTSPVTEQLRDVFFINNTTGWAVGDNGTILKTADGGQLWSAQTSGTTINITNIIFVDALNGYAVGGFLSSGNVALKTVDGGTTWNPMTVASTGDSYNDVDFSSLNHGTIITRDSIFTTSDAGANWVAENYVTTVTGGLENFAVSSFNDSIALVCGSRYKNGSSTSKQPEVFDRRLWNAPLIWGTSAAANFDQNDLIRTVEVASPTLAFAGGEQGIVYKLESDGINYNGPWTVNIDLMPVTTKQFIESISFPTDQVGMFITEQTVGANNYTLIYHTNDEGDTWSSAPDSIEGILLSTLHAPTTSDAWIVGNSGKIYKGEPSSVGINEIFLSTLRVYPNPAKEQLNIDLGTTDFSKFNYSVIDVSGRTLIKGGWNSQISQTINISNLKQGVYFLTITNDKGGVKTMQFSKN